MLTEYFVVVRSVKFGDPNDLIFRPAVETEKRSLSLSHDACTHRETRQGMQTTASNLADRPGAIQFLSPRTQQILWRWIFANNDTVARHYEYCSNLHGWTPKDICVPRHAGTTAKSISHMCHARSVISTNEVPIYPSQDLAARTVGDRIFLFHRETVTVETVLVTYWRRDGLGASNRRPLKAFGRKPHRQRDGNR